MTHDRTPSDSPSGKPRRRSFLARLFRRPPATKEKADAFALPPMSRGMQAFSMGIFFLLGAAFAAFLVTNPLGLAFLPSRTEAGAKAVKDGGAEEAKARLYQCPMHPEVVQSEPGECPICGMTLMPVEGGGKKKGTATASQATSAGKSSGGERKILYWYAPMDPTYIRDKPGLSPMGMKLVPKYADEGGGGGGEGGEIRVDPVQVQNIGVVSTPAVVDEIARATDTVGVVDFDADRVTWVTPKFEGWIEKVHVDYVGQEVRKGQPLFEIYSPELVTTQEEYLRALQYRASLEKGGGEEVLRQADDLLRAARERLRYWDISDEQIRALETTGKARRRLTMFSPVRGIVVQVMNQALEGMRVRRGMNLYQIADLSDLWVYGDVYESDLPWIRVGQRALVSFRNDPGRSYQGRVLRMHPEVNSRTRTLKVWVEVPNPDWRLRPGMYADVTIQGPTIPKAVLVPRSAVLRSGERDIVFLDLGEGRFRPQAVKLGMDAGKGRLQIMKGVSPGDRVVTQAQFMLDSESRIQEAIAKYREHRTGGGETTGSKSGEAR